MQKMHTLKTYLDSMTKEEQADFAERCKTSIGYLRKAISVNSRLGTELCVLIEKESNGKVSRKDLISDWETRWPELVNA